MSTEIPKIPVIKESSIINLEISGQFYSKIQTVLFHRCGEMPKEELMKVLNKLRENKAPDNVLEAEIHILTVLVHGIEKAALAQDKIEYREASEFTEPSGN